LRKITIQDKPSHKKDIFSIHAISQKINPLTNTLQTCYAIITATTTIAILFKIIIVEIIIIIIIIIMIIIIIIILTAV